MDHWFKWIAPAAIVVSSGPRAYAVQYLTVAQAQKLCFPGATEFLEAHVRFSPDQAELIEKLSGQKVLTRAQQVWKAHVNGKLEGYFVVDYVIGKHLMIDYAVALDPHGLVKHVEILEYRESYGMEIRSATWRKQFVGKGSRSPLRLNDDILNIGGATLSCEHVTEGVKRILALYEVCLK